MIKISKILVPIDFSDCSRAALAQALFLAEQFGATIDVLHVAEVPWFKTEPRIVKESGTASLREYAVETAEAELAAFLSDLQPSERKRISAQVDAGRARDRILDHAERKHYDLIVMGTEGRTGRPRSFAGSVAETVVRSAPCPVLTIREPQ